MSGDHPSREPEAYDVEQHVAAWGAFGTLVDRLMPPVGERRFSLPLNLGSAELADLAEELGVDDLLLRPGDTIGEVLYQDWKAFDPEDPTTLWSLGKMGLMYATQMCVPAEPTAVHLIGSSIEREPNWPPERFMGFTLLYHENNRFAQQTIGLVARTQGTAYAVRAMKLQLDGMPLKLDTKRRESPPWRTKMFTEQMREIIDSPYFQT